MLLGNIMSAQKRTNYILKPDSLATASISCSSCNIKVIKPQKHAVANAPLVFKPDIFLGDAVFREKADFENIIFIGGVDFDGSTFLADFTSYTNKFNEGIQFDNATFSSVTSFHTNKFKKTSSFRSAIFKNDVEFFENFFIDEAGFSGASFSKGADFQRNNFSGAVDFSDAKFNGDFDFTNVTFSSYANFSGATINGRINFNETEFTGPLILKNIITSDATVFNFNSAVLPQIIDLSNNLTLKTTIDLTGHLVTGVSQKSYMSSPNYSYLNLYNTNVSKVKIDYQHFRLCFYGSSEKPFTVETRVAYFDEGKKHMAFPLENPALCDSMLKTQYVQNYLKKIFPTCKTTDTVVVSFLKYCMKAAYFPGPLSKDQILSTYEQVLKNFKDNGQTDSYEALDIEYRDFKNSSFILPHIWNLYGYRREWVFYWALAFLAFFTITTTFFLPILNKPTAEGGVYHIDNLNIDPATERWYNRLWYAFMYTSTLFFILKVDVSKLNFKKKAGVFYIVLIYSLGVLCLGYMANFVLQK